MSLWRSSARVALTALLLSTAGSLTDVSGQDSLTLQDPRQPRATVSQEVRDALARSGRVRIIVTLQNGAGFAPEARLRNPVAVAAQRQRINGARASVLARLRAGGSRETRRYQTLPFVGIEVDAADLERIESSPNVAIVSPDRLMRPSLDVSVPHIEGDQAWQAGYDGTGTTIGVVDSGVDASHPFLNGKVVSEACFSSTSPGFSQSLCPSGSNTQVGAGAAAPCNLDGCYHGTHVAGIAAGNDSSSSTPVGGVARGASVVAVQVFSEIVDAATCGGAPPCLGGFETDVIAGLEYVYGLKIGGMNVAAVNMSLGAGAFPAPCDSQPFKPAIDNLRAVGVPSIVASGNDGEVTNLAAPACISSAVSVGATAIDDQVAWFSNVSSFLSLLAPGDGIVSSFPGGDFAALSGTSMAAPHVAGAWAVMHQAVPNASVDEILLAFRKTGLPVTDMRAWAPGTITVPRIRVFSALSALKSVPNPLPTLTSVTPSPIRTGAPATITLIGAGFNSKSVVRWNGVDLSSMALGGTSIRATVPESELVVGTAQLTVTNPTPGGGTSAALLVDVLPPPTLTVDQTTVGPGAQVTVTLANGYGGQLDWLAMAAKDAADNSYLVSTFVGNGVLNRTWTVAAPTAAGEYEFRLFLNNGFARVATSPKFTVDTSISPVPVVTSMSPTSAIAGSAPVTLSVVGSKFVTSSVITWNGSPLATTFVSATELRATLSTAHLSTAGTFPVAVVTPAPGGGTSAALTFTVTSAPVLTVSATSVPAGSTVTVTLTNGLGGSLDFFTFAPVSAANNSYVQFAYVGAGVTTRTWTVTAPTTTGPYEFRLFRQGAFTRLATSPTVTVTPPPTPTLSVNTTSVNGGQTVTVTLTNGQGGNLDWLSFGRVDAGDNGYVQFTYVGTGVTTRTWTVTTPNVSATYEFRLFRQGSFTRLATSPMVTVIGPPPPSPTIAVSQTAVATGASVTATLANGPGGATDYLALAATGAPDGTHLQSVLVGTGISNRTWMVTMPTTPGTYEFRLFVNGTRAATSPTVTVLSAPPTPTLTVNTTTAASGSPVTVTLTGGLGGSQDWLAFAPVSAPNNSYTQFVYVGTGVTTRTWTVTAPTATGPYEFRLFRQGGYTRLATSPTVTVQAPPPPVLTVDRTSVAPGQTVTVTLTNGSGIATDWFAFALVGSAPGTYVAWPYVGAGNTTRTWTVTAPAAVGTYEFRLFRQASFVLAATSPPVVVTVGP